MLKDLATNAAPQDAQAPQTFQAATLAAPRNPFERSQAEHLNAGAVAIESERAVAEAQGALVVAQRFPRDPFRAYERVLNACKRPGLAESAFYSFPRSGQTVSGPTIRLAEELARCWGNIAFGMRELSNRDGVSEIEAYAWDLETNTKSVQVFTVRHIRDTRNGAKDLTDQRDIYELGANMGSRRLRARILAILPDDLVSAAVAECKHTLAKGGGEPMPDRIRRTVANFSALGVSVAMLETYLSHPMDATTPDELADLYGVFKALRDGQAKVSDYFGAKSGDQLVAPSAPDAEEPHAAPAQRHPVRRGRPAKPSQDQPAEPSPAPAPVNDNAPAPDAGASLAPNAAPLVDGQGNPVDVPDGGPASDAEPAPLAAPGDGCDVF